MAAGPELWSLDSQTRAVDRRWTFDASVAAVLTTAFDTNLYVAVNDNINVFDAADIGSGPSSTIRVGGAPGLVAADPVPSVDNRGPTQCAC